MPGSEQAGATAGHDAGRPNYVAAFARSAERFPERVALEVDRRTGVEAVRYRELAAWAARAAEWLATRSIAAGDRVAILADNDPRWVAVYLGALAAGAVAVPLDTAYRPAQIAALIGQSGARVIFTTPKFLPAVRQAQRSGNWTAEIALLAGEAGGVASLAEAFVPGAEGPALPACRRERTDPAVILYTSGTTSDPKGVVLTHGNLLAEFEAVRQVIPISEQDAVLGVLPLFHALAQMANLLLPLAVGARVVYLETLGTTELMRALAERGITLFACVPQFFYLIHQRVVEQAARSRLKRIAFRALLGMNAALRRAGTNLGRVLFAPVHRALGPRMRLLVTGGSRFDPAVARDLWAMGFDVLEAYGLTETSGAATILRPGERAFGSVGRPLPGTEIRIAPRETTDGAEAAGERPPDGEILVRGPLVMAGYFERPDATAAAIRDGWFHTGDLGYLDARGRLWITGRSKEIIVTSAGKNIYPEEIEAHYLRSAFVKEICVVPARRPGSPAAERLHAVIVPDLELARARKVLNLGEAIRWELEGLSAELPAQKRVLSYEIWTEELPRTTTRKLKRFEIERRVAARATEKEQAEAAPPAAAANEEDRAWTEEPHAARALGIIRAAVPSISAGAVRAGANLELDCGLDSMERVELLARLEHEFAVRVPEEVAHRIYTVRELVEAVRPTDAGSGGPSGQSPEAAAPRADAWARLLAEAPADDPAFAALRRNSTLRAACFYLLLRASYIFWRVCGGLRVTGREHLATAARAGRGFLLCPNHQSYLDPFVLVAGLPFGVFRRLFFVGASEYFSGPLTRRIARMIRLVPVDPDTNLVRAMQAGAYGLRQGQVLVLFPEGERSIDGTVKRFKKGAAILAQHTRSEIVPVAMEGVFEVWPRGRGLRWLRLLPGRSRLRVTIGAPIPPPDPLPETISLSEAEQLYAAAAAALRDTVHAMWLSLRSPAPAAESAG
jgi:long-chain acyl-CoA synthetase